MARSATVDPLDLQIIHALQVSPRIAFSRVAVVLGVSEQTVARRYRRLRGDGVLRVIGLVDPQQQGQSSWLVRVGCRPGGIGRLAEALARRDDVFWVTLSAGGSEILCSVRPRSAQQRDDLLLQQLPATSQVLTMTVHEILHRFVGGRPSDWIGYDDALRPEQVEALLAPAEPGPGEPGSAGSGRAGRAGDEDTAQPGPRSSEPVMLQPEDGPLLDELARDGRASYAELAGVTGWTQGRTTRRVEALRAAGALYFDVDLATELMGFTRSAYLWLTVEPARLAAVGEQLAGHAEVAFAAAITGSANLVTAVICRDTEALYQYVTLKISAVSGVRQLEISPMLRRVKQGGTRMEGPRLAW